MIVVSDTSPITNLIECGLLDLLPSDFPPLSFAFDLGVGCSPALSLSKGMFDVGCWTFGLLLSARGRQTNRSGGRS
jgi:hypothetical protein